MFFLKIFRKFTQFSGIFASATPDLSSRPMANVSLPKMPIPAMILIWCPTCAKIGPSDAEWAQTAEAFNAFVAKARERNRNFKKLLPNFFSKFWK